MGCVEGPLRVGTTLSLRSVPRNGQCCCGVVLLRCAHALSYLAMLDRQFLARALGVEARTARLKPGEYTTTTY